MPEAPLSVPGPTVVVSRNSVLISFDPAEAAPPPTAALLVDGRVVASASLAEQDGRAFIDVPLPEWLLGGEALVVAVPSGRMLSGPMELGAERRIEDVWSEYNSGSIGGGFRLVGNLVPDAGVAIPVQLVQEGRVVSTTFAQAGQENGHSFKAPLPRLLQLDETISFQVRIGGVDTGNEVRAAGSGGLVGYLEPTEGSSINGWITDTTNPEAELAVTLSVGNVAVWTGPAREMREDVRDLELSDGRSGFRFKLPKTVVRSEPLLISARIAGSETQLANSPYVLPPLPRFVGCFDLLDGAFADGWAVNMYDPDNPLQVEAVCDGKVIGSGTANLFRDDVEEAGMPTARCGFRVGLSTPILDLLGRDVFVRIVGTDQVLPGSPQQLVQNENITRFLSRADAIPAPTLQRLRRQMAFEARGLTISIIMPVFNTKREWLLEALNSVLGQWSPLWELVCVDDGSTEPHVAEILRSAAKHDRRIRVMRTPGNLGIARAVNFGIRAARGEFVAFMDHDDFLEPDAVHKLAVAARRTDADLLYSDEAVTGEDINNITEVRGRPAFSYDYYLSHPYFVHIVCVRTRIAVELNGYDESLPISADVDFVLRCIENARVVTHVPGVLYRWRTHGGSTGHSKQDQVTEAMLGILQRHFARRGIAATPRPGLHFNGFGIDWQDDGGEVLIVIPTKNRVDLLRDAVESIEKTGSGANYRIVVIDHESTDKATVRYLRSIAGRHTVMPYSGKFNYAYMNNLAVRTHAGNAKYILFMNNDVEAMQKGWIERMRSLAARPDVGAVGCLLMYGDDRVQHAGVLMAFRGAADHVMKLKNTYLRNGARQMGYNCILTSVRDYSAVTAACLMVSREAFDKVDGFDEKFVVGFNDTDLCLRIGEAGFKVLYDGETVLYHHESATRTTTNEVKHPEDDARLRKRWAEYFRNGDPFYSPLLSPTGTDHTLRADQGCKGRLAPRMRAGLQGAAAPAGKVTRGKTARDKASGKSERGRRATAIVD